MFPFDFKVYPSVLTNSRKVKALKLSSKHVKVADLRATFIASVLAFQHGQLSPQSLMTMGGECFELRKQALQALRLTESAKSLELRVGLTKEVQRYEKKWRDRLLELLTQGLVSQRKKHCYFQQV